MIKRFVVILPPIPFGRGMVKSPPLDVASVLAVLDSIKNTDVDLYDFRADVINNDPIEGIEPSALNVFSDLPRCFRHLLVKEDRLITLIAKLTLKQVLLKKAGTVFFSASAQKQGALCYLAASLCIARELRKNRPEIKIVFFGNFSGMQARRTMQEFSFVNAFLEDGNELSLPEFLDKDEKGPCRPIVGICYRKKEGLVHTSDGAATDDLNDLPVPLFGKFDLQKYKTNGKLVLPYELSRGCLNRCIFCYYSGKGRLRYKNRPKVINELKFLSRAYDSHLFHFIDAAINFDGTYLEDFCEDLEKTLPGIYWSALAVPNIRRRLLKTMRRAGCVQLRWGVEYGSRRMLGTIGKNTTLECIQQTLKDAHAEGINNYVTLLTGFAKEDENDILQTKRFLKKMQPYIDVAEECPWGQRGYFGMKEFDSLVASQINDAKKPQARYKDILKDYNRSPNDVIDYLVSL